MPICRYDDRRRQLDMLCMTGVHSIYKRFTCINTSIPLRRFHILYLIPNWIKFSLDDLRLLSNPYKHIIIFKSKLAEKHITFTFVVVNAPKVAFSGKSVRFRRDRK